MERHDVVGPSASQPDCPGRYGACGLLEAIHLESRAGHNVIADFAEENQVAHNREAEIEKEGACQPGDSASAFCRRGAPCRGFVFRRRFVPGSFNPKDAMQSDKWSDKVWAGIRARFIQNVPPSLDACESCRDVDCTQARWLRCEGRLAVEASHPLGQGLPPGTGRPEEMDGGVSGTY